MQCPSVRDAICPSQSLLDTLGSRNKVPTKADYRIASQFCHINIWHAYLLNVKGGTDYLPALKDSLSALVQFATGWAMVPT
jgi:hypothetical protein